MVHARTGKTIGVVREVTAGSTSDEDEEEDDEDDEGSSSRKNHQHLLPTSSSSCPPSVLRVVNSDVPARFGPGAAEHHLLPYVRDVVPAARPALRTLVASPPRGLLRLGRQRLLIDYLKPRLHAIARELANAAGGKGKDVAAAETGGEEERGAETERDFHDDFDPERDFDDNESDDDDFDDDGLDAPRASSSSSSSRTAVMMPTLAQLAAWRGGNGGSGSGNEEAQEEGEEGLGLEDHGGESRLGQQLVRDVRDAGGAAVVAAAVGLRAKRRPVGYWDNLDTLDEELALFVAAHWVELSTSDFGAGPAGGGGKRGSSGRYYFNVATRRVRWDTPIEPATLEIDDCGTRIRIEGSGGGGNRNGRGGAGGDRQNFSSSSSERLMPGRAAVLAAGRYDLHHAIVYHGGYKAVQEMLSRSPAWPPSAAHDDPRDLSAELRSFARAAARRRRSRRGLRNTSSSFSSSTSKSVLQMPTIAEMADAGRSDLVQAVVRAGGVRAAAAVAGLEPRRPRLPGDATAPAASLEVAAEEIRKFVFETAGGEGNASSSTKSRCLPTHAALLKAGRGDLRYALQTHGSAAVAAESGLEVPRRGRRKKEEVIEEVK